MQAVGGLSAWLTQIQGDDKTCPSKLGQRPSDRGAQRGHSRGIVWVTHCFLQLGSRQHLSGKPLAAGGVSEGSRSLAWEPASGAHSQGREPGQVQGPGGLPGPLDNTL